jgi:ribosome biogenesis GTPase
MSQWDIPAILIFNKMDLFNKETNLKFEEERLKGLGVECFEVSSVQPEYQPQFFSKGMTNLKKHLQGKTAILLGQSGVGKSKLISELSDQAVDLLSAELGKVGKGSHTTTWAEMIDCQNFMLVDSPGIRSMSLGDIYQDEVLGLFPDLDVNSQRCKYQNCQHLENSQHCYFKTLDPSQEQNKPTLSRLESYQRIHQEASTKAAWERED